ncbi:MAG: S24/S26 family peptidase [Muribaculaceae bacterium]|nr:S24/S26 family peptidase [Muribaculaceae bacterium]MDE6794395.1 S24/S26 family peptidase [Muribaculaceae bacterium]
MSISQTHILPNYILLKEVCQLLAQGKTVKLRAKGNSMRPFIRGDIDTLLLSPPTSFRKGDIVLAKTENGSYIVHRIVKINTNIVILAGDNNLYQQEKCDKTNIYGTVNAIIHNGKKHNLSTPSSRLLALLWHNLLPLRRLYHKIKKTQI